MLMTSRFSLVPDEANQAPADEAQTQTPSQVPLPASIPASPPPEIQPLSQSSSRPPHLSRTESGNPITSVLQRLWGQSGSANTSLPTTPSTENPSRATSSPQTPLGGPSSWLPSPQTGSTSPHSGVASPSDASGNNMSSAIPADYRERHRRREQQQHQQQQGSSEPL